MKEIIKIINLGRNRNLDWFLIFNSVFQFIFVLEEKE